MRVSMALNGRDQNGDDVKTTIGYINPAPFEGTDSTVVESFKADCKRFAVAINSLSSNSLLNVILTTEEDITQKG